MLLPAQPNSGDDDTRGQLGVLAEADGGAGRLLACTLYAAPRAAAARSTCTRRSGSSTTRWLTIGSANLNEHSLFNDTEMNVVTHDPALARDDAAAAVGRAPRPARDRARGEPAAVIDELWRPIAEEQLERAERGEPLTHRLVALPHVSRRSERCSGRSEPPGRRLGAGACVVAAVAGCCSSPP